MYIRNRSRTMSNKVNVQVSAMTKANANTLMLLLVRQHNSTIDVERIHLHEAT